MRWIRIWTRAALLILALAPVVCGAQAIAPVIEVANPPNSPTQQAKRYVVLVSLDGFRYDYATKYGAKNLLQMAAGGASAPEGMIPSYPSVTFPNHYSIVTGLYPEHHGIVANSFYDPQRKERYSYSDPKSATDGSWYGGTPLWVLAEKQGMRAASFFWPGSEAKIGGKRPSFYLAYDDKVPDEKRVEQVIAWLELPSDRRPHFITLYYANTDHAGHKYGPDAPETADAVRQVDEMIGKLEDGIATTHLPVDLIVLSDHGMETLQGDRIALDKWADLSEAVTSGRMLYAKSEAGAGKLYKSLLDVSDAFKVYRRAKVPAYLHYNSSPREGDPVVVPTGPFDIIARTPVSNGNQFVPDRGAHGFDPATMPSMKAIFYASGPDIQPGAVIAPFENVNVYPLIAEILGLRTGPTDGDLRVLQAILRKHLQN